MPFLTDDHQSQSRTGHYFSNLNPQSEVTKLIIKMILKKDEEKGCHHM